MKQKHWAGVAALVVGALICGWQVYEVRSTDHFTFWMVKWVIPIPVPVIALGALFLFVGVVTLAEPLWREKGMAGVLGWAVLLGVIAWLLSNRSRYVEVGMVIAVGGAALLFLSDVIHNAVTRGEPRDIGTAGTRVSYFLFYAVLGGWWGWSIEHGMWLMSEVQHLRGEGVGLFWTHRLALVGIVVGVTVCVATTISFVLSGIQSIADREHRDVSSREKWSATLGALAAGLLLFGPMVTALFALAGWGLGRLLD